MPKRKHESNMKFSLHSDVKQRLEKLLSLQRDNWSQQYKQYFTSSVISLSLMGRATDVKDTNDRCLASIAIPINPFTRATVTPEQNNHSIAYSQNFIMAIDSFPLNPYDKRSTFQQLSAYVQSLSHKNILSKHFPNWQHIDLNTLENEIFCAYRTAEETLKVKSTFAKMIELYQQAQQPARMQHIKAQEHTVLNAVARYIKERPSHKVSLKILMPKSPMTAAFQAHELQLIEQVQWKAGQHLSRICGIIIEITDPEAKTQTAAYRYLCGLNTIITPQQQKESILCLKIKQYNNTNAMAQQQNALESYNNSESFLGTLTMNLDRRLTERTQYIRPDSSEIFQAGTTANNLNTRLALKLIDKRDPNATVHRKILKIAKQSIETLCDNTGHEKKTSHTNTTPRQLA